MVFHSQLSIHAEGRHSYLTVSEMRCEEGEDEVAKRIKTEAIAR